MQLLQQTPDIQLANALELAAVSYQQGQYDNAATLLQQATDSPLKWWLSAKLALRSNDLAAAASAYAKASKAFPTELPAPAKAPEYQYDEAFSRQISRKQLQTQCRVEAEAGVLALQRGDANNSWELLHQGQRIAAGVDVAAEALAWAEGHIGQGPVLVYSTAEPSAVRAIQGKLGSEKAGAMVEETIAAIARGLVQRGVRQLIVAGGETSGACVQALGITQMRIGAQIDPGVPWCHAVAPDAKDGLHITLKSGNFGSTDFFTKAFAQLLA